MINIPNALTILRILFLPLFIITIGYKSNLTAIIIFLFMSLTDFLDGFLARRLNKITTLGTILDPIADKLLTSCSFLMLYLINTYKIIKIPIFIIVITILRDIIILMVVTLHYDIRLPNTFQPSKIGKITTFLELFAILSSMLINIIEIHIWHKIALLTIYYLMFTTVCISSVNYLIKYYKKLCQNDSFSNRSSDG